MRSRSLGVGVVLTATLSFVFACSQGKPSTDDTPIGSTASPIQGGSDDGSGHPFAVGVCLGNKGQCQGVCSGALILPNLVVTARHCVQSTSEQIVCGTSTFGADEPAHWITTSDWMFQSAPAASWHSVKQVITPPDTEVCGNDLALLILDDVIDPSEAKPVTPGVQYDMGDMTRYAHKFTAIGYGKTSEDDPAQADSCFQSRPVRAPENCPGYRRIRENIGLLCIPGDTYIDCGPLTDGTGAAALTVNEFVADEGVCGGDSGSSAYEQVSFDKGAPVTFGVLSRGGPDQTDPSKCGQSVYTRLDKWRDLVVSTAVTASASWTLYSKPTPDWTIYIPPASDAGADADTSTPTKPTNLGDGTACETDDECASGLVCENTGAGLACTATCDPSTANTCTGGYACAPAGYCVGNLVATSTATPESATKGGCSATPSPLSSSSTGTVGLVAALGLMLNARRAARRRRGA